MRVVFKCSECETGPCYCEASNPVIFDDGYQSDVERPGACPYDSEKLPDWERFGIDRIDCRFCDELMEWAMGDGYERLPEKIRDTIAGGSLEWDGVFWGVRAMHAMNLLHQIDEHAKEADFEDMERVEKALAKKTRLELLRELLPNGFQAGIIYAFKIMADEAKPKKPKKVVVEMYEYKRVRVVRDIGWTNYNTPTRTLPAGWEGQVTRHRPGAASAVLESGGEFCICDCFLEDGSVEEVAE